MHEKRITGIIKLQLQNILGCASDLVQFHLPLHLLSTRTFNLSNQFFRVLSNIEKSTIKIRPSEIKDFDVKDDGLKTRIYRFTDSIVLSSCEEENCNSSVNLIFPLRQNGVLLNGNKSENFSLLPHYIQWLNCSSTKGINACGHTEVII